MNFKTKISPSGQERRPMDNWFVAQLKPGGLAMARRNLARQGFETFMPMFERTVRHARQEKLVQRPLFEGYLFVRFDPGNTPWRAINGTLGVVRLITTPSDTPQVLPQSLMQALLGRCDTRGIILPPDRLAPGDRVSVLEGPFKNFMATVESHSQTTRVRILLDLLGRTTRVECACKDVELSKAV